MVRTRHLMLFVLAVLCSILYVRPLYAFDVGTVVFPTAAAPSDGCVLAAVDGEYVADAQAAVARINEIRYEACNEGIDDPRSPSRKLTAADYVPVRWSSALEYIARVRAAEASIAVGHTRPNGNSCFTVYAPDGSHSYGEVLAWNHSSGLIQGINQWYGEKADWVNKTGRVTGHYEILINPSLTYVGIGCFLSDTGVYPNSTAGEFSTDSGAGETPSAGIADCRVILDIRAAAVAAPASILTDPAAAEATGAPISIRETAFPASWEFHAGSTERIPRLQMPEISPGAAATPLSLRWTASGTYRRLESAALRSRLSLTAEGLPAPP